MILSIAVVCEGPADRRTGCDIADRVVCEEVRWIEEEILGHCDSGGVLRRPMRTSLGLK